MFNIVNKCLRKNLIDKNFLNSSSLKLATTNAKPIVKLEDTILDKLKQNYGYKLIHAEINNVSWKHDKPQNAETHFELIVVSTDFESVKKEERVKFIQKLLGNEIKKLESITFKLLTPSRWYDSYQRGLKLPDIYNKPPALDLKNKTKSFYEMTRLNEQKKPMPQLLTEESNASSTKLSTE